MGMDREQRAVIISQFNKLSTDQLNGIVVVIPQIIKQRESGGKNE